MSYIEISNLNKDIKGVSILKNINLILEKGKIYGFTGRNGSGKTMLFRVICGLVKPTLGKVFVNGKELHKDISFPESLGVTIEGPGFWDNYTGFENLRILASIKNIITDIEIKKSIDEVGLNSEDPRIYKKYSLGMKQRLSIAQAIMESPELIILDEPTNGLDDEGVDLVRKILLKQKERGAIILISSHNSDDIKILADKKYKMESGKLYDLN